MPIPGDLTPFLDPSFPELFDNDQRNILIRIEFFEVGGYLLSAWAPSWSPRSLGRHRRETREIIARTPVWNCTAQDLSRDGKNTFADQLASMRDAMTGVNLQHYDRSTTDWRCTDKHWTLPIEMVSSNVDVWIKQEQCDRSRRWLGHRFAACRSTRIDPLLVAKRVGEVPPGYSLSGVTQRHSRTRLKDAQEAADPLKAVGLFAFLRRERTGASLFRQRLHLLLLLLGKSESQDAFSGLRRQRSMQIRKDRVVVGF
jgi:hypothetical protein